MTVTEVDDNARTDTISTRKLLYCKGPSIAKKSDWIFVARYGKEREGGKKD